MPGLSDSSGSPAKRERSERFGGVYYYDLLGVAPDATPEQIKAAWRAATDKFEPGAGTGQQFRLFNEAADVLLDPEKRAAYDAELGQPVAVVLEPTPEPLPAVALEPEAPAESRTTTHEPAPAAPTRFGKPVPVWLMALLALLSVAALAVGGIFWTQHRQDTQAADAGQEASAAAERALPVILSYDYRQLAADRDKAARFLSAKYKKEYTTTFDKLVMGTDANPGPASQAKAVVKGTVQDIGVVRAEDGRVRVIAFTNQSTTKDGGTPSQSLNRLTISMVKSGNTWLVDNINSY
jgi:Mce-associated membrane protein